MHLNNHQPSYQLISLACCLLVLVGCQQDKLYTNATYHAKVAGLPLSKISSMSSSEVRQASLNHQRFLNTLRNYRTKKTRHQDYLLIKMISGKAKFWPYNKTRESFKPMVTTLVHNTCSHLQVSPISNEDYPSQDLWLCWINHTLWIDPLPTSSEVNYGAIKIATPMWQQSGARFCRLSTQGTAGLEEACVGFRQISGQDLNSDQAESTADQLLKETPVAYQTQWKTIHEPE